MEGLEKNMRQKARKDGMREKQRTMEARKIFRKEGRHGEKS